MSTPTRTTTTANRTPEQAATSLFNDVNSTANAIERGDWLQAGMGVTNVAMDIISLGGDPLGAISSAGFGWLIGHIKFLREPFDKLLGDANSIVSSVQGWARSGQELSAGAAKYRDAIRRETQTWTGAAADAYRRAGETMARNLDTLSKVSKSVSDAMAGAGKALAEIRKAVLDIINQACNRIIMIIIEALAAAWGSFGASIAKGIAQSVQTAVSSAQKAITKIQKLIQTLQKIIQMVQKIMQLVQSVKQLLATIGGRASGDTGRMQITGNQLGYGGNISANTAPSGPNSEVNRAPFQATQNYSYDEFTAGTGPEVNRTPFQATQNYAYDEFTPGTGPEVNRAPVQATQNYSYDEFTPGTGPDVTRASFTPSQNYAYNEYTPGTGPEVQRTQPQSGAAYGGFQPPLGPEGTTTRQPTTPGSGTGYSGFTGGGVQAAQAGGTTNTRSGATTPQQAPRPVPPVTPVQAQAPAQRPVAPQPQRPAPVPQVPRSQNGWPTDPPRTARTVPGTNVRVVVADGPAGDVLMHVLTQVDQRVERLDPNATWGYAHREIRGGEQLSNHASATAVDVNAPLHALGARNTFTEAQVTEIRRILDETGGVVRWGGDYRNRADEMHFEIIGTPEEVQRAADRIRLIQERTP